MLEVFLGTRKGLSDLPSPRCLSSMLQASPIGLYRFLNVNQAGKSMSLKSRYLKFEHRRQPLLSRRDFLWRFAHSFLLALLSLAVWLLLGMYGYHWLAGLPWIDAFLNASMIVGGMGPVDPLTTPIAKLFAGLYAIFSGVIFLGVFGLLIAPVLHRFMHRFHLDSEEKL